MLFDDPLLSRPADPWVAKSPPSPRSTSDEDGATAPKAGDAGCKSDEDGWPASEPVDNAAQGADVGSAVNSYPGAGAYAQKGAQEDEHHAGSEVCWLCFEAGSGVQGELMQPCRCPRWCHSRCMARWQLHCAGRKEEKHCRFCNWELPDWRHSPPVPLPLPSTAAGGGPVAVPAAADAEPPPAYMRISYNGRSHKIRVRPGPDGTQQFIEDCRKLLKIPHHMDFDVVFHCKEPASGSDLRFRGLDAFDAAVYCAGVANQQATAASTPAGCGLHNGAHAPAAAAPPPVPLVRATSEVADLMDVHDRQHAAAAAGAAAETELAVTHGSSADPAHHQLLHEPAAGSGHHHHQHASGSRHAARCADDSVGGSSAGACHDSGDGQEGSSSAAPHPAWSGVAAAGSSVLGRVLGAFRLCGYGSGVPPSSNDNGGSEPGAM